jgi:isoleucyl-tRNA synthetase
VPAFLRICDDFNNWYIRRGRRRYWRAKDPSDTDKQQAYAHAVPLPGGDLAGDGAGAAVPHRGAAPAAGRRHGAGRARRGQRALLQLPGGGGVRRDPELEAEVALARAIVGLGLGLREREKIGVRRPLASLTVVSDDPAVVARLQRRDNADVLGELNIKEIAVSSDDSALVDLSAKPNLKVLGKKLGPKMKAVTRGAAGAVAGRAAGVRGGRVADGRGRDARAPTTCCWCGRRSRGWWSRARAG